MNSRHSRLKDFLRPRRGIATRYLDNYLSWFHLVGLAPGANDRACLAAAVHTIHELSLKKSRGFAWTGRRLVSPLHLMVEESPGSRTLPRVVRRW